MPRRHSRKKRKSKPKRRSRRRSRYKSKFNAFDLTECKSRGRFRCPGCDGKLCAITFDDIPPGKGYCFDGYCYNIDSLHQHYNGQRDTYNNHGYPEGVPFGTVKSPSPRVSNKVFTRKNLREIVMRPPMGDDRGWCSQGGQKYDREIRTIISFIEKQRKGRLLKYLNRMDVNIRDYILKNIHDLYVNESQQKTIVQFAIEITEEEIADMLINEFGARIQLRMKNGKYSFVELDSYADTEYIINTVNKYKLNMSGRNENGNNYLHSAAKNNYPDAIKLALEEKWNNPNEYNDDGKLAIELIGDISWASGTSRNMMIENINRYSKRIPECIKLLFNVTTVRSKNK